MRQISCPEEVVVGWTVDENDLIGVTHRGTVLRKQTGAWEIVGHVPNPDTLYGQFGNLIWFGR